MARKVASFRLETELLDWVGAYAKTRGTTQAVVLETALASLKRDAEGGVPHLPVADSPEVRIERAKAAAPVRPASSLEIRQRANPVGWQRQQAMQARAAKKAAQ